MPDEAELESATNLAVTLSWVAGAVVAAYLLGIVLTWVLSRVARRSHIVKDIEVCTRLPIRATLMVVAATIAVQRTADAATAWRGWVDHTLVIALIATVTWLMTGLVKVAERQVISRFGGGDAEMTDADRHRRRVRTQVTVLRRLAIAVVVILGSAAILMTFPAFSDIGTTLFASAGVLSVVAGLAAQTSLGSVFAGLQIAFSDAIRVGDVVVLEDEWGRIEEITLTYVVVRLWDERRLVLPCTYFTATPFQNWTRNATELMGTVELDVDYSVPFDDMRAELDRLLAESDLWDGRSGVLQVTDAVGGFVRVRMLVSAPNAGALFDLRCAVREGLVDWIRRTRGALPVHRVEQTGPPPRRHDTTGGETDRVASTMFSGSPEADARGRAFDDDFVGANGRGNDDR
ncbi:mechanosensitive ion channel family protein [Mycolicibacterium litorale]|uniref:mechanosensitive ion channel family protein n=1 Tax=Mycolicibacterium litorale TaxID=758802 RepID=UPI0039A1B139